MEAISAQVLQKAKLKPRAINKMPIVVFDAQNFKEQYPEFKLSDGVLERCFEQAELIVNNTDSAFISNLSERKTLLYLLVAHIGTLLYGADGKDGPSMVGNLSSATEGTVNISMSVLGVDMDNAWYTQTQYGNTFWLLTKKYRQARYLPGRSVPAVNRWFYGSFR